MQKKFTKSFKRLLYYKCIYYKKCTLYLLMLFNLDNNIKSNLLLKTNIITFIQLFCIILT